MPQTLTETALVTIAVAVSVQAVVGVGLSIGSWIAMRRLQTTLKAESAALQFQLQEALVHVRSAATSVSRLSAEAGGVASQAGRVIDDVSGAVRAVATTVGTPKALLVAGMAAGAQRLLRFWQARRAVR
jgi:hypothetical protein